MRSNWLTLARSFSHFLGGTLVSRVTGMVRDMATAYVFGVDASVAALMVAFRLSHALRRLLGEGALHGVFTPHYEGLKLKGSDSAARFFCDLRAALLLVLCVCVVSGMALLGGLSFFGLSSDGMAEVLWLTFLLLPGLLFICLYSLHASLLQSDGAYWTAGAAPAWLNIGWIVGVLSLQKMPAREAMPLLALCIVIATALQWIVTLPRSKKALQGHQVSLWRCSPFSPAVRALWRPLLCSIGGVAATQVNSAIDGLFARYADPSGPAYLWYAIRLEQFPLALFGIAIANVSLPEMSRAAKGGDHQRHTEILQQALLSTIALMGSATAALLLWGDRCISWIYGYGEFDTIAIEMTRQCLWGYTLGLIPTGCILCLAPAFYAKENYSLPMRASLIAVIVNILLNGLCVFGFGLGAASIAWSTGISAWINMGILLYSLQVLFQSEAPQRVSNLGY